MAQALMCEECGHAELLTQQGDMITLHLYDQGMLHFCGEDHLLAYLIRHTYGWSAARVISGVRLIAYEPDGTQTYADYGTAPTEGDPAARPPG